MDPSLIEREYRYRHSLFVCAFFFLFFGAMTAFALWLAVTHHGEMVLKGGIRLRGEAAFIFLWGFFGMAGVMFVVAGIFLWNWIADPNQRIAFTAKGILLPRNRWSAKEEFVEYREIRDVAFVQTTYRGVKEVTFLRFVCPQGTFSIARQKLTKKDFEDIGNRLLRRIQEANSSSMEQAGSR